MIEFAFAIPVFLVLIYYIHDLPKMKLIYRKNQFAANIMAAAIQNISKQCQTEGRNFTAVDLRNTFRLSLLSVFPGMTQYSEGNDWRPMPLGILPLFHMYCYIGNNDGTATLKMHRRHHPTKGIDLGGQSTLKDASGCLDSVINFKQTQPQAIYKDFQIQPEERKVIIDLGMYQDDNMRFGATGAYTKTVPLKSIWGFLFYTPMTLKNWNNDHVYFHAVTIFTPVWNFENAL